jgi:hypothetical protein
MTMKQAIELALNYIVPHNLLYFLFEFQPMNPDEK